MGEHSPEVEAALAEYANGDPDSMTRAEKRLEAVGALDQSPRVIEAKRKAAAERAAASEKETAAKTMQPRGRSAAGGRSKTDS